MPVEVAPRSLIEARNSLLGSGFLTNLDVRDWSNLARHPSSDAVEYPNSGIGTYGHSFVGFEGETVERGTGTVSFYDPQRNFGFIEPDDGGADVIFYLRDGDEQVDIGDTVSYDLLPRMSVTEMGRQAIRVTRTGFPVAAQ